MRRLFPLMFTLAAAACAAAPADNLASIKGPLVPLNPSRWQPSPADLAVVAARIEAPR